MSLRRHNLAPAPAVGHFPRGRLDALARQAYTPCLIGVMAFAFQMLVAIVAGLPFPQFHDEYSYLLAADTFAHGRLTNPTPAGWEAFESFHILLRPTYQSKYPPGQGLVLALGQVLTGLPIVGAWIAVGLACAAGHWMLRAWLPPRWALAGGMIAAVHPLLLEWGQTYWGGALAAGGGALVLGACARLWRRTTYGALLAFAAGVVVLAMTRPYEGLVLIVLAVATLMYQRRPARLGLLLLRRAAPAALVLLVAAGAWMYYNYRVTGDPLLMPYIEHERQYAAAPSFLFQSPPPPKTYRYEVMRQYQLDNELAEWSKQQSPRRMLIQAGRKLADFAVAYVSPPTLAVAVVPLPWLWRRRRVLLVGTVLLTVLLCELLAVWMRPHYVAPAFMLIVFLLTVGLRALWRWRWRGARAGTMLVALVLAAQAVAVGLLTVRRAAGYSENWGVGRQQDAAQVLARTPRAIVFLSYGPNHDPHMEWVYNGADLANAPIVWARYRGPAEDRKLMALYPDRAAWVLYENRWSDTALDPYDEYEGRSPHVGTGAVR